MSRSVNRVELLGNVGMNPIVNELSSGKVATITVATSKKWKNAAGEPKEETMWHNCSFYGKSADIVEKYVKKGMLLRCVGEINYTQKEDKWYTSIRCYELQMLSGKGI